MGATTELEVISIGRITDISTGEFIYQVQFGKMFDVSDKTRALMPGVPQATKQVSIVLVLNYDFKHAAPYRVGSRWNITIGPEGNMSLNEVME